MKITNNSTTLTIKRETKIEFDKQKAEFQGNSDEFILKLLEIYKKSK